MEIHEKKIFHINFYTTGAYLRLNHFDALPWHVVSFNNGLNERTLLVFVAIKALAMG